MKFSNQRTAYGEELISLGRENPDIVVCEADLGKSTMTFGFSQAFPKRFFEMGIAEANMTSFAAGLSLTGKVAFTNSFAVFAAGRAYDQIRQGIAIGRLNVKIAGSSAGLSDFGDGATHQAIEDIAIMQAIPNMTVLVPADAPQLRAMMRWLTAYDGPVYLRISRNDLPEVTGENPDPLAPCILHEGSDAAVIACGVMAAKALEAAQLLQKENISLRVINVPCVKPFPELPLKDMLTGVKAIIAAEEHSVIGGLSAAVSWALRGDGRPLEAVAVMDTFGQSALNVDDLMKHYHLTTEDIAIKVREALKKAK